MAPLVIYDESSAFWEGISTGDAAGSAYNAPYSSLEFNSIIGLFFGSTAGMFILPAIGGTPDISPIQVVASSPAAMTVDVHTGFAFMYDHIYYTGNVDRTLTIGTADVANPRIDRIVLHLDYVAQTIRLAVLTGTPSATPTIPSLTQTSTIIEYPLANIWVAAATTTIVDADIHDEREFGSTYESFRVSQLDTNMIRNSEFMAFGVNGPPPTGWERVGTISMASAAKPSQMSRGRAIQLTAGAGTSGLLQTFPVAANTVYAIRTLIKVTAGDVGSVEITTDAASPSTVTRTIRRTGEWVEEVIYYLTEADATLMTVTLAAVNNTDVVTVGQTLVIQGYHTGPFRQFHELLMGSFILTDASWSNSAKSTVTTTIDLTSSFSGRILPGTRALLVRLYAHDSGSAGIGGAPNTTPSLRIEFTSELTDIVGVFLAGTTNDQPREALVWVGLDSTLRFTAIVQASGAGTLDATIEIMGMST